MPYKIYIHVLGCDKNTADAEGMATLLREQGVEVVNSVDRAEIVLIHTCCFIESAQRESVEAILEAVQLKEQGRIKHVVVSGCMPQRFGSQIVAELPEVDLWLGTGALTVLRRNWFEHGEEIKARMILPALTKESPAAPVAERSVLFTPRHYVFVKLAEGCSHRCSFCVSAAGPRTVSQPSGIGNHCRGQRLVGQFSVREVNLIAQDTTAYGTDRGEVAGIALSRLLKQLEQVNESHGSVCCTHTRPA